MKRVLVRAIFCLAMTMSGTITYAQPNITQAEYYFDTDPGFGSGSAITIGSPATNIASLVFNANVAPLTNGMHTLFLRSKNASGVWCITNKLYVAKVQALGADPSSVSNIGKAEYFYDTDPGFGNGTNIPVTAAVNISFLVFNADVSALVPGVHTMYVRSRDAQGKWAITSKMYFAKVRALSGDDNTISNIVKAEYFYDADPGYNNGTNIPVTAANDISGFVFNTNVSSLANGVHTLYVRTKDAQGKWAVTSHLYFAKVQALSGNSNSVTNIVKAEYFFNADPGIGNGTNIPLTAANDISGFVFSASLGALPTGIYTIYVRTKDATGKWSISNKLQFSKIIGLSPNPNQLSRINKAEYFYDTDPGFGNGVNIPVTPAYTIPSLVFNANVSSLTQGVHTLFVRTRDSLGQWSSVNHFYFAKVQSLGANNNTISNIVKAEYYYDTDPGFNSGVDIPVVAGSNIASMNFNVNVAALTNGVHQLFVRTKDANNKWSVVNRLLFAKVQALGTNPNTISNLTRIEYFIDTDPGIGSGTSVPFTQATDVAALSFNVSMAGLTNGSHKLYIRTKDAQGKWSITNIHSFNGGGPLAIHLLSFDANLQNDNTVLFKWVTATEQDVAHYTVERSYDAVQWVKVGSVEPKNHNSNTETTYQMKDEQPGTGIIYYRLTETDLNGEGTQAPIRFVKISSNVSIAATVFPNPNDGKHISIQCPLFNDQEVTVTIVSADGKMFFRQTANNIAGSVFTIDNLGLVPGNYFIQLQSKEQAVVLKLIVADVN